VIFMNLTSRIAECRRQSCGWSEDFTFHSARPRRVQKPPSGSGRLKASSPRAAAQWTGAVANGSANQVACLSE